MPCEPTAYFDAIVGNRLGSPIRRNLTIRLTQLIAKTIFERDQGRMRVSGETRRYGGLF